ncbi:hypothetical protein [Piscinibacterium candidicorallinum]
MIEESSPSDAWRDAMAQTLVSTGCRYMMAWGPNASVWDDAVDGACIERNGDLDADDPAFVMTTWHDSESMNDVFEYCKQFATHVALSPTSPTYIIHVSDTENRDALLAQYERA